MGSLRNPQLPHLGNRIRELGYDVFDDWWAGGENADDWWKTYEEIRGRSYQEALYDRYPTHIWEFDKYHLDTSDVGVLMLPIGRSAHIELGYLIGKGKPTYVLFDQELGTARWDVMFRFAEQVFFNIDDLLTELKVVITVRPMVPGTIIYELRRPN